MRILSLFSGIEAASVAWQPLGFQSVAFAEVSPFPGAVLAHHYPDTPNLGDVCAISEAQIAGLGPIDVVVGGSPCQDISIAGRRNGLLGARSGLFYEQWRLFNAARKHCGARWLVWENVPGIFSSQRGRDFAYVVGTLAGCRLAVPEAGWETEGVALGSEGLLEWAVLDAQWFGLAQRRKRVFAVLDTGNWPDRPPILLEPESLRRDCKARTKAQQNLARRPATGTAPRGGGRQRVVNGLSRAGVDTTRVYQGLSFGEYAETTLASTLTSHDSKYATDLVVSPVSPEHQNGLLRRLTPRECERLQGFPDDYTRIGWQGKPASQCPDSLRYQSLGNSMAVPVMRWIGQQIQAATASAPIPCAANTLFS